MNYCESIGLKIGDKIRVLQEGRAFLKGSVIELIKDNGSEEPKFKSVLTGRSRYFSLSPSSSLGYLPEGQGWERVPAQDDEGWIEWKGGECPVEIGTLVDVKHRDGRVCLSDPAEMFGGAYVWNWTGADGDIIAYRLSKPEEKQEEVEMEKSIADQLKQTLKQQRKHEQKAKRHTEKATECEEKANELLDQLSAEIGVKLRFVEAMADEEVVDTSKLNGDIPDCVDVNDPETWQEGGVIVCVGDKRDDGTKSSHVTEGKEYEFACVATVRSGSIEIKAGDCGRAVIINANKFRFVRRPSHS